MESLQPQLLQFLPQRSDVPLKILTVGTDYLAPLREKFPNAALFAAVAPADDQAEAAREICRTANIDLCFIDVYSDPLPYPQDFFDYIVSDLTLEKAANPQDIAAGFGTFIKPTGAWLTSFRNIRHWSILSDLMAGHYWHVVSRLYAKQEFERLLYASFYKEVRFRPVRRDCPDDLVTRLTEAGFNNDIDDLNTEFWLVYAARSMPELALLKSMFDRTTRKNFSRIIHRIEYDVDAAANVAAFWRLIAEKDIFADYAAAFIEQTVFHHAAFYRMLSVHTPDAERKRLRAVTEAALRDSLSNKRRDELNFLTEQYE